MHQVIEFYEQNLRLARETADQRGEMSALNSLARAYDALDERGKAIEFYEQALQIARRIGDARGERHTLKHLNEVMKSVDEDGNSDQQPKPPRKPRKKADASAAKSSRRKSAQPRAAKPQAGKKT